MERRRRIVWIIALVCLAPLCCLALPFALRGLYIAMFIATDIHDLAAADSRNMPMDVYAKVVDQDGNAVPGADVSFRYSLYSASEHLHADDFRPHDLSLQTNSEGAVDVHMRGRHIELTNIGKAGYVFKGEPGIVYQWYYDKFTPTPPTGSPTHPMVFPMWKMIGEPEKLVDIGHALTNEHDEEDIPYSVYLTGPAPRSAPYYERGEQADADIWLTYHLIRDDPIDKSRVSRVRYLIVVPHGGIVKTNEPYPYISPVNGYQKELTVEFPIVAAPAPEHWFYIMAEDGKLYARVTIPGIQGYANINGSRNLQPGGGFLNR